MVKVIFCMFFHFIVVEEYLLSFKRYICLFMDKFDFLLLTRCSMRSSDDSFLRVPFAV